MQDAGITVYPKPTSGKFTISSKSNIKTVEVYDLPGARVYSGVNFCGRTTAKIDLSNLNKGTYIFNVHCGTEV